MYIVHIHMSVGNYNTGVLPLHLRKGLMQRNLIPKRPFYFFKFLLNNTKQSSPLLSVHT